MEQNETKQNKLTFGKILLLVSAILLLVCIFYWIQLSKFIDEFEKTLNSQTIALTEQSTAPDVEVELPPENNQYEELLGEEGEFFMELGIEVAQSYAKFTSADLEFSDIKNYFQEDSEILELIKTYNNNRYNKHENSYFEEVLASQPVLTENATIKCQVSFKYVVITSEDTHYYPSSYTLYFDYDSQKVTSIEMN